MSEMIERVAEAIAETPSPGGVTIRSLLGSIAKGSGVEWNEATFQKDMRNIARAAMLAMQEPTEAMLAEGWDNSPSDWCDSPKLYESGSEALAYIYRAMIDAALTPSPLDQPQPARDG